jgi:hypothetical protein
MDLEQAEAELAAEKSAIARRRRSTGDHAWSLPWPPLWQRTQRDAPAAPPDEPTARRPVTAASGSTRRGDSLASVVIGGAALLLLLLRAPQAPRKIWAEDGSVFLQDAVDHGPLRPFIDSYQGYFLLVPRAIGAAAASLPLQAASQIMWALVALVVASCAGAVYLFSWPWLQSRLSRSILAVSLVILPTLGAEAIANAANLQFMMVFASMIVLLGPSWSGIQGLFGFLLVISTGLTTPIAIFLAPIAALRILWRRPHRVDSIIVAWLLGITIQIAAILIASTRRTIRGEASFEGTIEALLEDVLFTNLAPLGDPTRGSSRVFALGVATLLVCGATLAWRNRDRRKAGLIVGVPVTGSVLFLLIGLRFGVNSRYMSIPAWCVIWSLLVSIEVMATSISRKYELRRGQAVVASAFIVALLAMISLRAWAPSSYRSSGPYWRDSVLAAEYFCSFGENDRARIRVAPVAPRSGAFFVRVSCASIT